jgi:hypothetical protein
MTSVSESGGAGDSSNNISEDVETVSAQANALPETVQQTSGIPNEDRFQTFHKFTHLPPELQLIVLSFVCEMPRVIPIWLPDKKSDEPRPRFTTDTHEPSIMMVSKAIRAEVIKSGAYVNLADFNGDYDYRATNIWVSKYDLVCPRFDRYKAWLPRISTWNCRSILAAADIHCLGIDDLSGKLRTDYLPLTFLRPAYLPPWLNSGVLVREMMLEFESWVDGPREIVFYSLPRGHILSASTNLVEVEEDQLGLTKLQRRSHNNTVKQFKTIAKTLARMRENGTQEDITIGRRAEDLAPGLHFLPTRNYKSPSFKFMMVEKE